MNRQGQFQVLIPLVVLFMVTCVSSLAQEKSAPKSDKSGGAKAAPTNSTKKIADGKAIFKQLCASCHAGGGNSVKPAVPLAESSKLVTIATFKAYLESPPGHMPHYENLVQDSQLLDKLHKYCKTLKKSDAPKKVASR